MSFFIIQNMILIPLVNGKIIEGKILDIRMEKWKSKTENRNTEKIYR